MPPSLEVSVDHDLFRPSTQSPLSEPRKEALETFRHELDSGQITTFTEVASLVNSRIDELQPELAPNASIFSARCQGAQAMYDSRKVRWLLDSVQRAANHIVSPGWKGDVEASHPPLPKPDAHALYEENGLSDASSLPKSASTTASTSPTTPRTREKKPGLPSSGARRHTANNEVSQSCECPHCGQTFAGNPCDQKSNLNRHVDHKHPHLRQGSTRVCCICGEGFGRSDYLLKHKRSAHSFF